MELNESYAVRCGMSQLDDDALAVKILLSQTDVDREVIVRFYVKGETAQRIEESLGLNAGYVGRLRRLIKARFLQERRER